MVLTKDISQPRRGRFQQKWLLLLVLLSTVLFSQCTKRFGGSIWCKTNCHTAGDEQKNTSPIFDGMYLSPSDGIYGEHLNFGLRIGVVRRPEPRSEMVTNDDIITAIQELNQSFDSTGIQFFIEKIEIINEDLSLEQVVDEEYKAYKTFSAAHDLDSTISLFIFEHGDPFCKETLTSIQCSKTGAFAFILSKTTNNVVISYQDIKDKKVVAHEFGHFFGLYHTFEFEAFGKDNFDPLQCGDRGDRICDTPPDPGPAYEIYVNYYTCQMEGYAYDESHMYHPNIDNYMSYYKPCYMRPFAFTPMQRDFMNRTAHSDLRLRFSRPILKE